MKDELYSCIMLGCGGYYRKMFDGIEKLTNCQFCVNRATEIIKAKPLLKLVYRATHSRFIRVKYLKRMITEYWFHYEFEKNIIRNTKALFVLFQNNSLSHNTEFLKYLKKRYPESKTLFWLTNTLETYPEDIKFLTENYDEVLTFSKKDADRYGFLHHEWCYAALKSEGKFESDVFFCGWDKGRRELIEKIYLYLSSKGIRCDFTILTKDICQNCVQGINYTNQYVPYDDIFERMKHTSCLLEVMPGKTDNAPTLRWAESIALSKKLLTNNVGMDPIYLNDKQYNLFTEPEDIDLEWLVREDSCFYANPEVISPKKFILDLIHLVWHGGERL